MVLKKSIKQNLLLKNLSIDNVEMGTDGMLCEKKGVVEVVTLEVQPEVEPVAIQAEPVVKNALVFLPEEKTSDKEVKITQTKSPKKAKNKKELQNIPTE